MKIEMKRTERGFVRGEFKDRYDVPCSIQASSLAEESCIWLGSDDERPIQLVPGQGWQPVPMPDDYLVHTRMHLNQEQVRALLPLLIEFAETGELPRPAEEGETCSSAGCEGHCGEVPR